MPSPLKVIARLITDDNIQKNWLTNTWHFVHPSDADPDVIGVDCIDQVHEFYTGIASLLGNTLTGDVEYRLYDLDDPKPRIPHITDVRNIGATGGAPMPHEVAVVMSLRATLLPGDNPRRRRGRVYIGPIVATATTNNNGGVLVSAGAVNALGAAAVAAFSTDVGVEDPRLQVYSPTTDLLSTTLDAMFPVAQVLINNSFDTQRRRGLEETATTAFPLPQAVPVRSRRVFGPVAVATASPTDLYLVPAGRTAIIRGLALVNVGTGSTARFVLSLDVSGVARRMWSGEIAAGQAVALPIELVLNPGDLLFVTKETGSSINVSGFGSLLEGAPQ